MVWDGLEFVFFAFCVSMGIMVIGVTVSLVIVMVSNAINGGS